MKKSIQVLLLMAVAAPVWAQSGEVFSTHDGAINGYDPVAYFTENKPVKGQKEFSYTWNGAQWSFSSKEHLDLFKAAPGNTLLSTEGIVRLRHPKVIRRPLSPTRSRWFQEIFT